MGNNPSSNVRSPPSHSASPSPGHDSSSASSRRVIHPQRSAAAAAPEPSLAQARGTTITTHRPRPSQSTPLSLPNHPPQSAPTPPQHTNEPAQQSREIPKAIPDQPSKPVDVPAPATNPDTSSLTSYSQSIEPSGPPQDMSYHLTRPPRLPLPIEEEVHTPGSPIIAPADVDVPALDIEPLDEVLPRRSSALSNTTIDEEDAEELRVDKTKATVPTTLEWLEGKGGEKVYVTGTIFQWNKKHRLHPVEGKPGVFRSFIHVRPGTHHVRFIVDGVMTCSKNLPTTVDFGNNLVNYIEVSADDLPKDIPATEEAPGAPGAPVINPEDQVPPSKKHDINPSDDEQSKAAKAPKTKPVLPAARYSSQVPQYLLDLDKEEGSEAYQYAAAAIEKLPTPPTLPGFLGKPILNAATPMKDDNSVLTMPNHTVLNHLATSSIKNNVLAVSATTRYKRKYVTTIMYKPTGDD